MVLETLGIRCCNRVGFALQSLAMEPIWAAEHLQIIRTLMERSALYRRALAPVMIVVGSIGVLSGLIARTGHFNGNRGFSAFWMGASLVSLIAAFLLVRRQALKAAEPFWSVPTRRITQALLPQFLSGLVMGALVAALSDHLPPVTWLVALLWTLFYGFALHAAGFFMQRGIKFFGWFLVIGGAAGLVCFAATPSLQSPQAAHLMGLFFGLLHLAYGVYLYFTEQRRNTA